jgi:hypothetical protein
MKRLSIALSCTVLLLASCKKEKRKVIYDTINKGKKYLR